MYNGVLSPLHQSILIILQVQTGPKSCQYDNTVEQWRSTFQPHRQDEWHKVSLPAGSICGSDSPWGQSVYAICGVSLALCAGCRHGAIMYAVLVLHARCNRRVTHTLAQPWTLVLGAA